MKEKVKYLKEHIDLLYEEMGKICLTSSFMDLKDQERVADLVEEVIHIIKKYERKENESFQRTEL